MDIQWGIYESPFGEVVIGLIEERVCWMSLESGPEDLKRSFPGAKFKKKRNLDIEESVLNLEPVSIHLIGTEFQMNVWEALITETTEGETVSYGKIAKLIGKPTAVRAVANAVANNKIAFYVPCHRVIKSDGSIGGFRWGIDKKKEILAWESVLW